LKLKTIWGRTNRGEEKVLKLVEEAFEIIKGWKEGNTKSLWEYSRKTI
jgi:hypothetical protein